ncbi:sirohydrochlorin chelatase [Alicyclobacillus mali (ex Roth et al. 2021)]|uniref:sirohydrochlorin chelatase n=1 Tax=Alicyclobacillus mali (ex Roth et al. 2021) TaxID=1123961 RepID=UPI001A8D6BA6|nr:sirohydrochlorin chelatase [Alicyclobacillus mali (ex Roth et al. 2021)]
MTGGAGKVLFIGHGTRLPGGMHMWHRFVDDVAERAGLGDEDVARAFVEIAQPDVAEALVRLAAAGVRRVHMVPLLLFSAGHMRRDLPQAVARAEEQVGRLDLTWSQPFGDEPAFIDVAVDRAQALVARMPEGAGVVLVGRGNRDEGAQRAFAGVAENVAGRIGRPLVHGYLAGTGRSLEGALEDLWRMGCGHIAVVPYLWFPGLLTEGLPQRVNRWRGERRISFRVAEPLGRDPRLVSLVAERARQVAYGPGAGSSA